MVPDGAYPVFGANGIIGRYDQYNHEEPQLLITCRGATCGSVNISERFSWITGNAMVVRPKNAEIDMRFLEYLFRGGIDISKAITGAAQPQITRTNLSPLQISYPTSPTEQRRIVAILDEAFAGIATACAHAEQNLQNARALFESYLQTVFTERGEGWVEKSLDDIAEFSQGIQVGLENQSTEMSDGLVRFIRIVDYTQQTKDVRFIQDPGRRYWVNESDIVMVRYGTPGLIGRGIAGVIANNLFKITVSENTVLNDYLSFFLGQAEIQHHLATQGSSTMPALTFKQLGKVSIAYPLNKIEQEKFVRQATDMLNKAKRLESLYQRKLAALDELKESLLHQAFSGSL